jgi:hypothetical protein
MDELVPADWDDESILGAVDQLLDVVRFGICGK